MFNINTIIANHLATKLYHEPSKSKRKSGLEGIEARYNISFNKNFRRNVLKGSNNKKNNCILDFS